MHFLLLYPTLFDPLWDAYSYPGFTDSLKSHATMLQEQEEITKSPNSENPSYILKKSKRQTDLHNKVLAIKENPHVCVPSVEVPDSFPKQENTPPFSVTPSWWLCLH